jgi:hypothetical protein
MNLSSDEIHAARALFAELAVDMVEPGQRADIPVPTFADAVSSATRLPFYDACDLIEASISGRKGVSIVRGHEHERVRLKLKEDGSLVSIHRTGPPTEAEILRRLLVQTLIETPTWSGLMAHVAADIAEQTSLPTGRVFQLINDAVPCNTEALVKRHNGVHQLMHRNGRLSIREARFSEATRGWFALLPPPAVQIALEDAKRWNQAA